MKSSATVLLILLGVLSRPVASSAFADQANTNISTGNQQPSSTGTGIISGVVVNERREPVARARVHAVPVGASVPQAQGLTMPVSARGKGST